MKKNFKILIVIILLTLTTVGCSMKDNNKISVDELNIINNNIINYFNSNNVDYFNMSFNYVDETNLVVVVGLYDDSDVLIEEFKKKVIDSEYITFVKSSGLMDTSSYNKNK